MYLVHPVQEEHCKSLLGQPVFVVTQDGKEYFGILSNARKGKLILNDTPSAQNTTDTKKAASVKARKNKKAAVAAAPKSFNFPVPSALPFPGPKVSLDLPSVTLLYPVI